MTMEQHYNQWIQTHMQPLESYEHFLSPAFLFACTEGGNVIGGIELSSVERGKLELNITDGFLLRFR